jgi:hypothetical protein
MSCLIGIRFLPVCHFCQAPRFHALSLILLKPILSVILALATPSFSYGQSALAIAQQKSQRMAQVGFPRLAKRTPSPHSIAPYGMRHVQPLRQPRASRGEGVGFSPHSPGQALRNACFYGQRPIMAQAVVRGRDGYYATVYYR